jgi:HPt (histidine-containing phosphotransfer) domain-containing protein
VTPTPEERVAAARARMAELKEKFIERTEGELQTLRSSFASLEAGDAAALTTIVQLAHRITGTGATLGLDALSDRAQEIEKLGETLAPGSQLDGAMLSRLGAAIGAFAAELERAPRAG